jgi:hypothetical protein
LTEKIEDKRMDATQLLSVMLLPIARMLLRSGFGAGELIRAAKQASVRAALIEVIPLGSRVNVSRLSVATGLTRKEISNLLGRSLKTKSLPQKSTLEQRAWRVLRGWHSDPKYRERSGRLAALPFAGKQRTFSSLVRRYGGDVTPRSVLRELERIKVVTKTRSGTLRLHSRALHSRSLLIQQLSDVARVFRDFAATVAGAEREGNARGYFGFKEAVVPSVDQAALFQHTFAERGAILLESFEQWLKGQTRITGKPLRSTNASVRVGVGVYLVQDSSKLDASGHQNDREPIHSSGYRAQNAQNRS